MESGDHDRPQQLSQHFTAAFVGKAKGSNLRINPRPLEINIQTMYGHCSMWYAKIQARKLLSDGYSMSIDSRDADYRPNDLYVLSCTSRN